MEQQPPTVILDVAAEVDIPENGTLSRVLYQDEQIRLVAFAFDAGQELTEHTAAVPAVIQVVEGTVELGLSGEVTTIGAHSWVHLPAGLSHAVRAVEPSIIVLSLLKGG